MKLYYKPGSPYARKARVVVVETGQQDRVELVKTTTRDPESTLLAYSPVGKVPCLICDDGTVFHESGLICQYLDSLHDGPKLFPREAPDKWVVLGLDALATGLLDGLVWLAREQWRPEEARSADLTGVEHDRIPRCLDALEADAARLDGPINMGQITLGIALSIGDRRPVEPDWRAARPKLAEWYTTFAARPSMVSTAPD